MCFGTAASRGLADTRQWTGPFVVGNDNFFCRSPCSSKYPPAEPEALRLLAPQRGLIATGEKQKQLQRPEAREATDFGKNEDNSGRYTPGILKV